MIGLKASTWPLWLQIIVIVPHSVLLWWFIWNWPKSTRSWRWFVVAVIYLEVFYLVFLR